MLQMEIGIVTNQSNITSIMTINMSLAIRLLCRNVATLRPTQVPYTTVHAFMAM